MKNIFAVFLYLVLLATSGQAFAATYFSNNASLSEADFASGAAGQVSAKWNTDGCTGSTAATAGTAIAAADTFTICDGHTLTLGANLTFGGASITVGETASGILVIGNSTLTMNTAAATLTNTAAGTITIGSGGISFAGAGTLANTGTFTPGTGTVTFGGNASITGTIPLNNLTVTGTLAIPNTATIAGNVSIGGAVTAAGNGLKLTNANHGITATAVAAISKLDTASMTAGKTITFTPPTTAGQAVAVTGFTVPTTPSTGVILTCSGGTVTGVTSPLISQTGSYTCTKSATTTVSAPIFSTKEKPAVFSEEVKH